IFGLDAGPVDETIAVCISVRSAQVREPPWHELGVRFDAARDASGLVHIAAETTETERIDGEAAKRNGTLQAGIKIRRTEEHPVICQTLIDCSARSVGSPNRTSPAFPKVPWPNLSKSDGARNPLPTCARSLVFDER